jgi:hypothetical protein
MLLRLIKNKKCSASVVVVEVVEVMEREVVEVMEREVVEVVKVVKADAPMEDVWEGFCLRCYYWTLCKQYN